MRRAAIAATAIFANWGIVSLITDFLDKEDSENFLEVIEIPEFEEHIQAAIRGWDAEFGFTRSESEAKYGGCTESESEESWT